MRPQERITAIYQSTCGIPCEYYNSYSCIIDGAFVNKGTLFNKIADENSRCALNPPKWIEEPPTKKGCGCG
jgi:hypothetical protein